MVNLDFPAGANPGDLFTGTNGAIYEWDGQVWMLNKVGVAPAPATFDYTWNGTTISSPSTPSGTVGSTEAPVATTLFANVIDSGGADRTSNWNALTAGDVLDVADGTGAALFTYTVGTSDTTTFPGFVYLQGGTFVGTQPTGGQALKITFPIPKVVATCPVWELDANSQYILPRESVDSPGSSLNGLALWNAANPSWGAAVTFDDPRSPPQGPNITGSPTDLIATFSGAAQLTLN